ncbi:ATPase AAA [Kordiimonas sediminis]|uniref:ATPase AAA n=1 Tax=Kordiimonas sediminis TaxID=1735581 RepID=A0A919AP04_9PROT|nr:YifB family Mg chelatase-like AAA ATPase [Kordiimonas sediminis]GHF15234.1 ATPase AAA [Kordiimonas sediminis]
MVASVYTVAFEGIEARTVEVQVQISSGLPAFTVVGLPDKAVSEARERVRAALSAIGLALPAERITVNLSPADLPKEGSHYDLPILLGILLAMETLPEDSLDEYFVLGELGLDASIRSVTGVLPAALQAGSMGRGLICPYANGAEAAWAASAEIVAPKDVLSLINHIRGSQHLDAPEPSLAEDTATYLDMRDIKGQESAKRALEIAAAGGHNVLMIGPPGAGKSMLASRMPSILPPLMATEALEVSMIASVAGELQGGKVSKVRPFRSPHHSASQPSIIGGGARAKPGEVSLAHGGVLFLDELPEFTRATLEALRQPLESGKAVIARVQAHVTYPARFQLIAAMNPCKCGYLDDEGLACNRAPKCALDYQGKISGPLYDRIDLHVEMGAVSARDLSLPTPREGSGDIAKRVANVRALQRKRYEALSTGDTILLNAHADGELLEKVATPDDAGRVLLLEAAETMRLTARGYHRVLRVARTIADMAGSEQVGKVHIAEALAFRRISPQAALAAVR